MRITINIDGDDRPTIDVVKANGQDGSATARLGANTGLPVHDGGRAPTGGVATATVSTSPSSATMSTGSSTAQSAGAAPKKG